jgi:hypothetical protein
MGRLCRS